MIIRWVIRALVALACGSLAVPGTASAQTPPKVPRVGYIFASTSTETSDYYEAARQGLRELGYVEGRSIALEVRWAEGRLERLPELLAEVIRLGVDVLVVGSTPGALAAQKATTTIPVVLVGVGDPVKAGLAASLARPGGNLTGLSLMSRDLSGKRLQLLKEMVPRVTRIAILTNPGNPGHAVFWQETQEAAQKLGVQLQAVVARRPEDFAGAFRAAKRGRADALLVFDDGVFNGYRTEMVALAARTRLPAMYGPRHFPDVGGLISYGPNWPDQYRRTAVYVDKILKGAKPADLPVEQPTRFELVINLKTAKALKLTIPQSVLIRADQVIQ
jgi:putative ABC transport system substrate-binding protein